MTDAGWRVRPPIAEDPRTHLDGWLAHWAEHDVGHWVVEFSEAENRSRPASLPA